MPRSKEDKDRIAEEKERLRADKATRQMERLEQKERRAALKEFRSTAKLERRRSAELPDVRAVVGELERRPRALPLEEYVHPIASQHGEDGVTVEMFRRVGIEHRRAVELGCGSNGGNAAVLVAGL